MDSHHLRNYSYPSAVFIGAASAFLLFTLFLQTSAVSNLRLLITALVFVLITLLSLLVNIRWLLPKLAAGDISLKAVYSLSFFLPLAFLPIYFAQPDFPVSPLLRGTTNIAIQFDLDSQAQPVTISDADLKVITGNEVLGLRSFELNGTGRKAAPTLMLEPGESAWLEMEMSAASTVTLKIKSSANMGMLTVYWDRNISVVPFPTDLVLKKKLDPPLVLAVISFLSVYLLIAYVLLCLCVWLGLGKLQGIARPGKWLRWAPGLTAILFSAITVYMQTMHMFGDGPFTIQVDQYTRHLAVLQGTSLNPWQYRVFSEWVAAILIWLFDFVFARGKAIVYGFMFLRLLQNFLIFLLAHWLYERMSMSRWLALLGILILASSMLNANYDSDLAFNTYSDIIFYLGAVLLILDKRYYSIIPLTALAALNRETSGLIPFLVFVSISSDAQGVSWKKYLPAVFSLIVWVIIFFTLRWVYPDLPVFVAYGHLVGVSMWLYNVNRSLTWGQLFRTLGLLPLVSLLYFFNWPRLLQWFFIILIPAWFAVHFVTSVVAETRLFLVPQAVIFIPVFLCLLKSFTEDGSSNGQ